MNHASNPEGSKPQSSDATPMTVWTVVAALGLISLGAVLGMLFASSPVRTRTPGPGAGFAPLISPGSLTWLAVAISAPVLAWMVARFPISRDRWIRSGLLYFAVVFAFVLLTTLGVLAIMPNAGGPIDPQVLLSFVVFRMLTGSLPFWALIGVLHAIEFQRRSKAREVEAAHLEAQLVETRLDALASKIQPHFLFNTLQGISTLLHRDPLVADRMLTHLSTLLRSTLTERPEQKVTLQDELDPLREYVEITRLRLGDRLTYEQFVTPEAEAALVPYFILQPLLENAFEHGVARQSGAGVVVLQASREDAALVISISDDGPGLSGLATFPSEGIGLSNTRARLETLYGDSHSLTLQEPAEGGLRVELTLPFET